MFARPERYCAVSECSTCEHFLERALRDELAAARAGAGAEVDHVIGGADGVLIVLDHDDGIAEIAQAAERADEPVVVALVQADARLIEHVEAAREAGADLRREPDALRFAAAERAALAIEREVAEADLDEEIEPVAQISRRTSCVMKLLLLGERELLDETRAHRRS